MAKVKEGLYYAKNHEWVEVNADPYAAQSGKTC